MGLPSGMRANARGFDRNQRKDIQGPEANDDRPRTNDLPGGDINGDDGFLPRDPTRDTGLGLLDAADIALHDRKQTPQDITVPTERTDRRNPNDDERPPPALKPPEEDEPIIPGDPDDFGARGRRRGTRDDVNASPVLRRGLLGV